MQMSGRRPSRAYRTAALSGVAAAGIFSTALGPSPLACCLLLFAVAAAAWHWDHGPALALAAAGAAGLAASCLEPAPRAAADGALWLVLFVPSALGLALLAPRLRARSAQPHARVEIPSSSGPDAERRLRDELRARDELVCFAAHELRTPLGVLSLQLQAVGRAGRTPADRLGPERLEKTLALALRQVERLTRLVDDLLEVSRIGNGSLRLEIDELDLCTLARELVSGFQAQADASGCTLSLDAPDRAVGRWDRLRIEQVASNLVSNALKYGAGGPVEITVRADSTTAWLIVRDHGIGMTPSELERIFAPFVRAASVRRRYTGLGVGLYVSRRIVEAHGGSLDVQSAHGTGSTFTVLLPRRLQRVPSAEAPEADAYVSLGVAKADRRRPLEQTTPSRE